MVQKLLFCFVFGSLAVIHIIRNQLLELENNFPHLLINTIIVLRYLVIVQYFNIFNIFINGCAGRHNLVLQIYSILWSKKKPLTIFFQITRRISVIEVVVLHCWVDFLKPRQIYWCNKTVFQRSLQCRKIMLSSDFKRKVHFQSNVDHFYIWNLSFSRYIFAIASNERKV